MWQKEYVSYISMVNIFDELEDLLCKLKKNEENVPLDVLNTKYKNSYTMLKEKIKMCIQTIILNTLSNELVFSENDTAIMEQMKQAVVNYVQEDNNLQEVYRVAHVTYDFNTVMEIMSDIYAEIEATIYFPYWFSKVIIKDGVIYSTLTHCWRKNGNWISKENKSYVGFPATWDEIDTLSCYKEYRAYIKKAA